MTLKFVDIYSGTGLAGATRDDVDGVIVKATQGTGYVNPIADQQYQAAKKKGRLLGFYHYAGGSDPVAEANFFYSNTKNYFGEAVPCIDWESYQNSAWNQSGWCEKFVNRIHDLTGVWCLLYTGSEGLRANTSLVNKCGLWFAGYPDLRSSWDAPEFIYNISPWKSCTLWQFTNSNGALDRSLAYVDAEGWKRIAKGDASPKPSTPSTPNPPKPAGTYSTQGKTLDRMIGDTYDGLTGSGNTRIQNLGKFYTSVQAGINANDGATSWAAAFQTIANEVLKGVFGVNPQRKQLLGTYYDKVQAVIDKTAAPSVKVYTVQPGDSFFAIGQKLGVNPYTLASQNGLTIGSVIYPGQKLKY